MLGEVGWEILNGGIHGDEEGEYTYTGGRGETVIDYVLGDENTRREIESLVVEDRVDSDHQPLVVTMKRGRGERIRENNQERKARGGKWTNEMKAEYERRMQEIEIKEKGIQELIEETTERIKREIRRSEEKEEREERQRKEGWWDEECRGKRRR